MGRTRLPPHVRAMIPAAERQAPKPKRQPAQNGKLADGRSTLLAALSEREFQTHVLDLATRLGWRHWHDNATNAPRQCPKCRQPIHLPRNSSGLPDLILVRRPRLIWAELKSQDGVTSPEQREWIAELRAAGQEVHIWRPADWPTIERLLT